MPGRGFAAFRAAGGSGVGFGLFVGLYPAWAGTGHGVGAVWGGWQVSLAAAELSPGHKALAGTLRSGLSPNQPTPAFSFAST